MCHILIQTLNQRKPQFKGIIQSKSIFKVSSTLWIRKLKIHLIQRKTNEKLQINQIRPVARGWECICKHECKYKCVRLQEGAKIMFLRPRMQKVPTCLITGCRVEMSPPSLSSITNSTFWEHITANHIHKSTPRSQNFGVKSRNQPLRWL